MKVQVIKWLISHEHAVRMMKKLNMRRHAHLGFYFEYEDVGRLVRYFNPPAGDKIYETRPGEREPLHVYSDYHKFEEGGILTVYRDIAHPDDPAPQVLVWLQRQSLPELVMAEAKDARRELGKWLNEQPNREVDKRAIATLIAVFDILVG
jgi:hypothetical protein